VIRARDHIVQDLELPEAHRRGADPVGGHLEEVLGDRQAQALPKVATNHEDAGATDDATGSGSAAVRGKPGVRRDGDR